MRAFHDSQDPRQSKGITIMSITENWKKLVRPKEQIRFVFTALVLLVAVQRAEFGSVIVAELTLTNISVAATAAVVLLMVLWTLTFYEVGIIYIKDAITRRLGITNYRHWFRKIGEQLDAQDFDAEEVYGQLKWDCPKIKAAYPHRLATMTTPALHTFYLIPVAWLPTLFWTFSWDIWIVIALGMIPLSFLADIRWETKETNVFKRHKRDVEDVIRRYCDDQQPLNLPSTIDDKISSE